MTGILAVFLLYSILCATEPQEPSTGVASVVIELPEPSLDGDVSLEAAIASRRSVRAFADTALEFSHVGQLLWAAQGITGKSHRFRTAPSAGALCPLEVYLVAGDVIDLAPGVYHYQSEGHALTLVNDGDQRKALSKAAYGQDWLASAPAVFCIAAVYERTAKKYGERSSRYVPLDAGHASENVLLQVVALGLGACPVGGFDDNSVAEALYLPDGEVPLLAIPVGYPK